MSKWLQEFYPVCFLPEERAMLPCLVGLEGSNGSQVGCVGERSLCPGCEQEVLRCCVVTPTAPLSCRKVVVSCPVLVVAVLRSLLAVHAA